MNKSILAFLMKASLSSMAARARPCKLTENLQLGLGSSSLLGTVRVA